MPGANPRTRARALFVGFLVVFSLFGAQLVRVQTLDAGDPSDAGLAIRTVNESEPAMRGTILDATGAILATSIERRTVTVNQQAVAEYTKKAGAERVQAGAAGAAADLAPLLGMDRNALLEKLTGSRKYYVVAKNISPLTWHKISALGIPGIASERTSIRRYPQSTTAASLVGFVDEGQVGRGGIERVLDKKLRGEMGTLSYEVGQDGVRLPNGTTTEKAAKPGRDVRLTIRNDLQWWAQNALARKVQESKALSGTVVVQDVRSGNLLALASYPTFDPNNIDVSPGALDNRAFTEVFEPGSTAKVMTAAAALEEGKVTPSTPMIVPYAMHRSDKPFSDAHKHDTEYLTFAGALAQSSNTGIILAGEQMSPATIEKYFRKFGIGALSGANFPGESPGLFSPSAQWNGSQRYTVLYGQGVSITAIQAAMVYQTIANKGLRMPPTLIDAIAEEDGEMVATPRAEGVRVVSPESAMTLSAMLEGVVSKDGTAPEAQIDGYRVAGKTGTAKRYNEKTKGYTGYTSSFIGYAPAEDPRIVVSVIIQDPQNGYYGGVVAAPVFRDVMTYALQSLKIAPSPAGSQPPAMPLKLDSPPDINDPAVLADRRAIGSGTG